MKGAVWLMLRQQEPGLAEGLCTSFSTGQSLPITLTGPRQADLSLFPGLSLACSQIGRVQRGRDSRLTPVSYSYKRVWPVLRKTSVAHKDFSKATSWRGGGYFRRKLAATGHQF